MSTENSALPEGEEEKGWSERLAAVAEAWQALLQTRLAIFREELAGKLLLAAKGLAAVAIAAALGVGALLLAAALLAALFAQLFHSVVLGILAAGVVYAVGAGIAGWIGSQALARVRPTKFSALREELSRDWSAVRSSLSEAGQLREDSARDAEGASGAPIEDLEERFRAGAE